MNPVALAGAWGFLKGLVAGRPGDTMALGDFLAAPVIEEMMFRAPQLPVGLSSAAFAAAHLTVPMIKHDPAFSAYRFAEVFAGGVLYDMAYKRWGLAGAAGTHMLHNLMCTLGGIMSPRPTGIFRGAPRRHSRPRHRCRIKR
jgi:membrane protease YdiL (CAAX protease family)